MFRWIGLQKSWLLADRCMNSGLLNAPFNALPQSIGTSPKDFVEGAVSLTAQHPQND
jgi:hypothetical protein